MIHVNINKKYFKNISELIKLIEKSILNKLNTKRTNVNIFIPTHMQYFHCKTTCNSEGSAFDVVAKQKLYSKLSNSL